MTLGQRHDRVSAPGHSGSATAIMPLRPFGCGFRNVRRSNAESASALGHAFQEGRLREAGSAFRRFDLGGFAVEPSLRVPRAFPAASALAPVAAFFLADAVFASTPRFVRSIPITLISSTPGKLVARLIQ